MGVIFVIFVVDLSGEMWEVEGLFVGDGSLFLIFFGVNFMIIIQFIVYCIVGCVVYYLK